MGRYNVSKIDGVELRGSLISNMILTAIALIILFAVASRGSNQEKLGEVLLGSTEAVMGKQNNNSKWLSLGLLIFETSQKMKEKETGTISDNLKDHNYSKIYERMKEIGTDSKPEEYKDKSTDELRGLVDTDYNKVESNLIKFINAINEVIPFLSTTKDDKSVLEYLEKAVAGINTKVEIAEGDEEIKVKKIIETYNEIFPYNGDEQPDKIDRNTVLENRYVLKFLKDRLQD